jgi:methionine synthase II (cobalamin-independent)
MFATLLGALPRPPLPDGAPVESLVEAAVRAQEAAGLDPVTDGGLRHEEDAAIVAGWEATQRMTGNAVKQALIGPHTFARLRTASPTDRRDAALARAATLNVVLRDLARAGCPLIEIHEPAAVTIGADEAERALFREAHLRLLDGVEGSHRSLAITGGNADGAGIETILAAPYHSLALDLIAGPDNWRLAVAAPGDRGIVCGALSAAPGSDDGPELLLWAVAYAASTGGRGVSRVGLATASSLGGLPWEVAIEKIERLGAATRLADRPFEERVQALDPRAVSSRSAALGRVEPRPARKRSRDVGEDREPT